jgi:hypothetical protein
LISGRTIDLGESGMRLTTSDPLQLDEVLHFELPADRRTSLTGEARVVREQPPRVYGLWFPRPSRTVRQHLADVAARLGPTRRIGPP